jgi:hypothetical protein
MKRVTVRLTDEEYYQAVREAKKQGLTMSGFLRRSLRDLLPIVNPAPWMRFAGMIQSGDSESSQRVDEIVYGDD